MNFGKSEEKAQGYSPYTLYADQYRQAPSWVDIENRKMSRYSSRHSVGTSMTRERELAATKAQLRHRSAQTTMARL